MAYKAILAGASGLTGSALLSILLEQPNYEEVTVLVRKALPIKNKILLQVVVDFDRLDKYADLISGHAIFCCLGTTKKKTPNADDYRKIDHDYPLQLAQIGLKNGISQFHFLSSLGANAKSSTFYLRTKGETEDDIKNIGLSSLDIYQPSFLTGDRKDKRNGEKLLTTAMKLIDPILKGGLEKYSSIPAATVAMAMFKQSLINKEGIFIHPSDQIKKIA